MLNKRAGNLKEGQIRPDRLRCFGGCIESLASSAAVRRRNDHEKVGCTNSDCLGPPCLLFFEGRTCGIRRLAVKLRSQRNVDPGKSVWV